MAHSRKPSAVEIRALQSPSIDGNIPAEGRANGKLLALRELLATNKPVHEKFVRDEDHPIIEDHLGNVLMAHYFPRPTFSGKRTGPLSLVYWSPRDLPQFLFTEEARQRSGLTEETDGTVAIFDLPPRATRQDAFDALRGKKGRILFASAFIGYQRWRQTQHGSDIALRNRRFEDLDSDVQIIKLALKQLSAS